MEWKAWEIVQLPRAVLESHPRLKGAHADFERARASHAKGDWPEVLGNCYKAFEQLAADGGQGGKKDGFARFFLEAFPDERNAEKRTRLDALVSAVSSLCQVGRHVNPSGAWKPEAETVLNITASLLSLFGRALQDAARLTALESR